MKPVPPLPHLLLALALTLPAIALAAEHPLLPDHPGSFQILSRTDYTLPKCGFSRAEVAANLERLTALVAVVRRNPILAEPRGFEGRARIYNTVCDDPDGYAVPVRVSFEFSEWFVNRQGQPAFNAIEPPEWTLLVNKPRSFTVSNFEPDKTWFTMPGRKETLAPGIDLYDGLVVVVYDPRRPPYHLPLTVGEAFAKMKAYWSGPNNPNDPFTAAQFLKMIEAEAAATPRADLDQPAHDKGGIGAVADPSFPMIVRVNPDYWDRSLAKGAIQMLTFRMNHRPTAPAPGARAAAPRPGAAAPSALRRFEDSLDLDAIKALQPLLGQ